MIYLRIERENMGKTIWIINHYAIPPSMGGLNRHYYFKKYLEQRGYKVRIFTSARIHNSNINMTENGRLFTEKLVDGIEYTFIKSPAYSGNGLSRIRNMLSFSSSVKKIWKHYKHENPDVIYTSSPDLFTARAAQKLARKHKIPNVVEIRDLWPLSIVEYKNISERNPIIKYLYRLEKKLYKRADAIVFTMPNATNYIVDKHWDKAVKLDKIFNINNGVDLSLNQRQLNDFSIDEDLFASNKFKVVYCGSVREANKVGALIGAAESVQSKDTDVQFIIYGDGNEKPALENICLERNIDNVVFKGHVDKKYIPYICANADLNVISVKQTDAGKYGVSWNKLFDYMAAGKPILSTVKVGKDLICEYNCGKTCENQDPETIANDVLYYKNLDKDKYEELCKNAELAANDFDYSALTDKFENVIEYVLSKEKQ